MTVSASTTAPSSTVLFTFVYANAGTGSAAGVAVSTTVPTGAVFRSASSTGAWSCGDGSPAGTNCAVTIGSVAAGGEGSAIFALTPLHTFEGMVNLAAAISDDGARGEDTNGANNTASGSSTVSGDPDLTLSISANVATTTPSSTILFTLSYANNGTISATGTMITETVPVGSVFSSASSTGAWSCANGSGAGTACTSTIGFVPIGTTGSQVFAITVLGNFTGTVTNTASIGDDATNGADQNSANNTASTTVGVSVGVPQLSASTLDDGNAIFSMGQSLGLGFGATPALSTTSPFSNVRASSTAFVPLIEESVESPASALANTLRYLAGSGRDYIYYEGNCSNCAYNDIASGTAQWLENRTQLINSDTARGSNPFRVIGLPFFHGESDHNEGTASGYAERIQTLRQEWETLVRSVTGQLEPVPMFIAYQLASFVDYIADSECDICIDQLEATVNDPNRIFLVGPGYQYTYQSSGLDPHMVNTSFRYLGEMVGKVMKRVLIDGESWKPLQPTSVTASGNVVTVAYHNPSDTPLVWDETNVAAREVPHRGFEYYDPDLRDAPTIVTTTISGNNVLLTLTNPPRTGSEIRYAYSGRSGIGATLSTSPAGNLRNSDSTVGYYGGALYDWAVVSRDAIVGTSAAASPDGTAIGSRNWTLAFDGADCQTAPDWSPITPYVTVTGTQFVLNSTYTQYTCNAATTGLSSTGIGASRVNKGISASANACWHDNTGPHFPIIADGEDLVIRLIFRTGSDTAANKYLFIWNRGAGDFIAIHQNGATLNARFREGGMTTLTRTSALSANTLYFIDIYYDSADPTNPSVDLYVNGTASLGNEHSANFEAFEAVTGIGFMGAQDCSLRWDGTVYFAGVAKGSDAAWFSGESTHDSDCADAGVCT